MNLLINFQLILSYDISKKEKRLLKAQKLHKGSVRKLAYPQNNCDLIFTASKDKSLKLNDLKQESNVLTIENAHESPINCMITIDNWLIATGDDNGCVKVNSIYI
jgi:WD40 repeat protein